MADLSTRFRSYLASSLALWLAVCPVAAEPANLTSDQLKAQRLVDSVFGAKLKTVKETATPTDDIELAQEFLKVAKDSADQPALVAILCDHVVNLTVAHATGRSLAEEALQLLIEQVPADRFTLLKRLVNVRQQQYVESPAAQKRDAGERWLDAQVALAQASRDGGDLNKAVQAYEAAIRTAGLIRSPRLDPIRDDYIAVRAEQKQELRIAELRERVLNDVNDRHAVTELLSIYIIERDDPASAQKYAERTLDEAWRKNVPLAAFDASKLQENDALSLADWYLELADKAPDEHQRRLLQRAKTGYERFRALHTTDDLLRKRVDLAVKAIDARITTQAKLTTLKPVKHQIWLKPEPHIGEDRIWAHPYHDQSSMIEYDLGGKWRTLRGAAVLADKGEVPGTLTFRIVGDGKVLWRSKPIVSAKNGASEEMAINIAGVRKLQLFVDCSGKATNAWASWDQMTLDIDEVKADSLDVGQVEGDKERLEKALAGTTWSFTTTREPASITFHADKTVGRTWIKGLGEWWAIDGKTVKAKIMGNPPFDKEVTIEFTDNGRSCVMTGWDANHSRLIRAR